MSPKKGFIWKDIGSICVTNDRIDIYIKPAEQAENVELSRFQLSFCALFLIKWKITESTFPFAAA